MVVPRHLHRRIPGGIVVDARCVDDVALQEGLQARHRRHVLAAEDGLPARRAHQLMPVCARARADDAARCAEQGLATLRRGLLLVATDRVAGAIARIGERHPAVEGQAAGRPGEQVQRGAPAGQRGRVAVDVLRRRHIEELRLEIVDLRCRTAPGRPRAGH